MSDSLQFAPPPGTVAPTAAPRSSVIQLAIKEVAALHQAYIPLFSTGGIFVPSTRDWRLGDDLYVLLSLPDDPQRYPIAGKVAWITPARAQGGRSQGVGIRFPDDEKARQLCVKIEQMVSAYKGSERSTQTV